ncbi:MAG: hypothetical protein ACRD01_06295 [Terriglobales bacterium]
MSKSHWETVLDRAGGGRAIAGLAPDRRIEADLSRLSTPVLGERLA